MRNPNSEATVCSECYAKTRLNLLTGRIYYHQPPGQLASCMASGRQVVAPVEGEKFDVQSPRYEAGPSVYRVVESDGSSSVKAISGGLPGKGKRR